MLASFEELISGVDRSIPENCMKQPPLAAFFGALLAEPRKIGAIVPSGGRLARLMTSEIEPTAGKVLELGPGTGVFTAALLKRGLPARDLTLVELETRFIAPLQQRFPNVTVLQRDARELASCRAELGLQVAIVSGLPFRNMPIEVITAIVGGGFSLLERGGAFYQFTYGQSCSVPSDVLGELGLRAERLGRVRLNLPPASVFRISRIEE
ncbi:phospholipid N-methyltransferase [Rhizobium sp. BK529]|uniref:class I SAM-dependent methyltransferase n=1 Tax=Rhizobium sp. BK529 TaxID=2586983 RepID=UPI001815A3EF|nr:rRNA adenine N-6-methyltransferase family protein [Rhizobium sp. BK529]MBB3593251.1 phospholipid N-methyltransferase [Rhizobium sp. BK529]